MKKNVAVMNICPRFRGGVNLARHLKAARRTKIELSLQRLTQALAQGIKATWLLVAAWFTSPKFYAAVRELGLHVIGRLKADGTLYTHEGQAYNLRQLYRACRHLLTPVPEMGLAALPGAGQLQQWPEWGHRLDPGLSGTGPGHQIRRQNQGPLTVDRVFYY